MFNALDLYMLISLDPNAGYLYMIGRLIRLDPNADHLYMTDRLIRLDSNAGHLYMIDRLSSLPRILVQQVDKGNNYNTNNKSESIRIGTPFGHLILIRLM